MRAVRRTTLCVLLAAVLALSIAPAANAAGPYELLLGQSEAFSILGHSCGGIQEESFTTGFAPSGFPTGDVRLRTSCGGSGRGGGYKTTTYSGAAGVVWDWFGNVRSFTALEGVAGAPAPEETDAYGDRLYDVSTHAYLETGEPPLRAPGAPGAVAAALVSSEGAEEAPPVLSFSVSWTSAGETAALITSSTITATPVGGSTAPVLSSTISGTASYGSVGPLASHTSYSIVVTSTDDEGTSEQSLPIEVSSGSSSPPPSAYETCRRDEGSLKLSPGLSETPHVQRVTVTGTLSECEGDAPVGETATYVDHLQTTGELTCSALSAPSGEALTEPVSLVVKWTPKSAGISHGALLFGLSEAGGAALAGTLEGGPFAAPEPIVGGEAFESFAGGPSCGVAEGKKKAKAVKSGTFVATALELEAASE